MKQNTNKRTKTENIKYDLLNHMQKTKEIDKESRDDSKHYSTIHHDYSSNIDSVRRKLVDTNLNPISRKPSVKSNEVSKHSRNQSKKNTTKNRIGIALNTGEKLAEVMNYRKKINEEYNRITPKTVNGAKHSIISKWIKVVKILQGVDVRFFLIALKNLADVYLEFDEYEKAKNWYFFYKFLSYNLEMLEEVLLSYECIGNVYKYLYQYHKAIKCYKKQIEVAWVLNDKNSELRAYDNIGLQYFYLCNREKARYYHERMLYGRSESQKSEIREKVTRIFKEKNFHLFYDDKYSKNIKKNEELKEQLR